MDRNRFSEIANNLLILAALVLFAVLRWEQAKVFIIFVLTLGVLVAIHEWGHFIAARAAGVHVYEFALGFGPKLFTYMRRGGTEYTVRALPLGGFVNLKGMQPDDPITPDGLNGRRPAERALVYFAGPLMNFVLALVVFCAAGALLGRPDPKQWIVAEVTRNSPAQAMGLRVGDRILAVNGRPVDDSDDIFAEVSPSPGKPVTLRVERDGREVVLTGTPRTETEKGPFISVAAVPEGTALPLRPGDQLMLLNGDYIGNYIGEGGLREVASLLEKQRGRRVQLEVIRNGREWVRVEGIAGPVALQAKPVSRQVGKLGLRPSPGQGPRLPLGVSLREGWQSFVNFFRIFYALFQRGEVVESVGGPLSILGILAHVSQLPPIYYANVLAQLSLSLAVFNLIPIPVLDGGHLLLLGVEVLQRRRLAPEAQRAAQMFGLAIIGALFILIMLKDIGRWLG